MSTYFFCNPHKYNELRQDKYVMRIGFYAGEGLDICMELLGFASTYGTMGCAVRVIKLYAFHRY